MYITNAVIISNAVNGGTGDSLRVAFSKINASIQSLGNTVVNLTQPTAIDYTTANTVVTLGDSALQPIANMVLSLGTASKVWSSLYVGVVSTNDLTVTGTASMTADGGSY